MPRGVYVRTPEIRKILSLAKRVIVPEHEAIRCAKISAAKRGKMPANLAALHAASKGRPKPLETRRKIAETIRRRGTSKGSLNPGYIDGNGSNHRREKDEQIFELKVWRTAVFKRDDYTCQECGRRGVVLNADHIKSWRYYPALRFDVANGRTLCVDCHYKTTTYGARVHQLETV